MMMQNHECSFVNIVTQQTIHESP